MFCGQTVTFTQFGAQVKAGSGSCVSLTDPFPRSLRAFTPASVAPLQLTSTLVTRSHSRLMADNIWSPWRPGPLQLVTLSSCKEHINFIFTISAVLLQNIHLRGIHLMYCIFMGVVSSDGWCIQGVGSIKKKKKSEHKKSCVISFKASYYFTQHSDNYYLVI